MYPFLMKPLVAREMAVFGFDGDSCSFLTSFSIDVFYSISPFKLKNHIVMATFEIGEQIGKKKNNSDCSAKPCKNGEYQHRYFAYN